MWSFFTHKEIPDNIRGALLNPLITDPLTTDKPTSDHLPEDLKIAAHSLY